MKEELAKSVEAAYLEFKEEPMDSYYNHKIAGYPSRLRVRKIIHEIGNVKGKKVLDVGCEAGYVSMKIAERGAHITSIDVCEPALEQFRAKIKGKHYEQSITIMNAMAHKMPFEDNSFDVVVCTEVIEHMPEVDTCFAEMHRVLKPGGKLVITFPNENLRRKVYPVAKMFGINTDVEEHVTLFEYTFPQIKDLLKKRFEIAKGYSIPILFPLTRVVVCQK